ncbi:MAG: response regulator [Oscillatoriales cyanobacterium RM2_1_1]|nr:response regulator [Oscillatoriales cyanobacterium SM2_3_0]NJO45572.1 response regulator [Oscillatoriales cyanobacterium RM2_1_1]
MLPPCVDLRWSSEVNNFPPGQCLEAQGCGNRPCVLVVEDHEDSLMLLTCVLQSLGCFLVQAGCAIQALQLAEAYAFDLALIDIVLPDINGLELLRLLKLKQPTQEVVAIAVTALASIKYQAQIRGAGFQGYICKPYLLEDLEALIRYHLRSKLTHC